MSKKNCQLLRQKVRQRISLMKTNTAQLVSLLFSTEILSLRFFDELFDDDVVKDSS